MTDVTEATNAQAEPQAMQEIPIVRELKKELDELRDQARLERRYALEPVRDGVDESGA